ncbi:hypothetical protein BGZ82_000693 [Podila clonocystis]|nr:hypothetical protein BGZ82_000693 [Podila clonocystis]
MSSFTLPGKQPELKDQPEHFNDSHDRNLIPQKRAWVPDQEDARSDTDKVTSKRIRCKGSPMEEEPIPPGHRLDFWDRFCYDNYNNSNEVSPEKAAHFLQDDILQRTRTVWIKQGSEFEGAIGCTCHDPLSNPFAADAEALSRRKQIRTALAQNAGGSVQNVTVPVAEETIDAYLKALDLRWYQQCSGGKAPISQRPSFCQPVKDTLEAFRRRLIFDTIKVGLEQSAQPVQPVQLVQLDANTATRQSPPQPNDSMSVQGSRGRPFSLVEQAEDDYDSGTPTSDEDEDLPVTNPVSPLRQEEWPQEPISQEEGQQDLEAMRQMHQERDLEAQLQELYQEELETLLPSDLAPEITQNLSCIQGEIYMDEVVEEEMSLPLRLELRLCEQEELMPEEEEKQDIQLSQGILNEEPSDPVLVVLDPITPITEEDATLAFREFLREGSGSCVQTPAPFAMDVDTSESSSSETQSASPPTPLDQDERFKVDGQALILKGDELDRLRGHKRRGSDPDLDFGVVPEYKEHAEEDGRACKVQ